MLPNQNISIWMAPLPTATPETHQYITTPFLVSSHQLQHPTPSAPPPKKKHQSHTLPPLPFSFRSTRGTTLLKKKFEKEWETVWEVFPELSDTRFLHKKTIFLPEPQFS